MKVAALILVSDQSDEGKGLCEANHGGILLPRTNVCSHPCSVKSLLVSYMQPTARARPWILHSLTDKILLQADTITTFGWHTHQALRSHKEYQDL